MRNLLVVWAVSSVLLFAEPSAFSAGDLTLDNPYGLTENEKLLLKNIKSVKNLKRENSSLESQVTTLQENLDGIRSLLEGQNSASKKREMLLRKILVALDDLEVESISHKKRIDASENNITQLKGELNALVALQKSNYVKIEENFKRLGDQVEQIEKNYVSQKSFKALEGELVDLRSLITAEFKKLNKSSTPATKENGAKKKESKASSGSIYQKGLDALKEKKYHTALEHFQTTIKNNYRPASSHFYAGEAYYHLNKYGKAASYYKESYRRYKKGRYNNKLFLHMAISLEKTGKDQMAQKFFKTVLKKYPNSEYAKEAKKHLH